jgi:hypothetical protein
MAIPNLKEVVRATFAMDGGSICLYIHDESGEMHRAELVQHMIPLNSTPKRRFGRLYFDDRLIDVRSEDEATLMIFLESAPGIAGSQLEVKEVVAFVRSDEYVQLARRYTSKE